MGPGVWGSSVREREGGERRVTEEKETRKRERERRESEGDGVRGGRATDFPLWPSSSECLARFRHYCPASIIIIPIIIRGLIILGPGESRGKAFPSQ